MEEHIITTPINPKDIEDLVAGDLLYLTGYIYTGRDAAHKRLLDLIDENKPLPFDFANQVIYYAGPCPNKPNQIIGSIGPTTSSRMDRYTPKLMDYGLKYMIGKGKRSTDVTQKIKEHKGMYFSAIGGAAALMSKTVKSVEDIAFLDLGTEAIRKLYVEKLPVIVTCDTNGSNIY